MLANRTPKSVTNSDTRHPAGTLDPAERARQAAHARKAYFLRLALKSAKARRKAKEAAEELAVVDRELAELGNGAA